MTKIMQVSKIEISRLKNYALHIVKFYYLQAQDTYFIYFKWIPFISVK